MEEDNYNTFVRLFCDDEIWSQFIDDNPVFATEDVEAERERICASVSPERSAP